MREPQSTSASAQKAPSLVESRLGETVVRGWFVVPSGEIVVDDLATFRFSTEDALVTASPAPDARVDDVVHSFYTTVTPLVAWAVDGVEAIHASAVHHEAGVIAFCGPTESGKTTLAHALATRGYERYAEDALAFLAEASTILAVALPFTVSLREPTSTHFGGKNIPSRESVHVAARQKSPLSAVFVLAPDHNGSSSPTLEQFAPAQAMLELLPNAHRFRNQPGERDRQMFETYLALVDNVPIYRLTYPQAFEHLEEVLDYLEQAIST
jgi:hypothetical protein